MNDSQVRPHMGFWKETGRILMQSPVFVFFGGLLCFLILGAIFIPMASSFEYAAQNVAFANQAFFSTDPVSGKIHWFGTDYLGRDIFVRLWYGARISLTVAGVVAVIDCVVGVLYGGISGYLGGRTDMIMMRTLEIISGIPYMIVVLLLMATLPQGIITLIVAYSLVGWTGIARLVRGQVLSLCRQEFVVAAKMMGAGTWRIIRMHLFPSLMNLIIVQVTLDIPNIIFTEAFLSMLGLGVPPPYPSLGSMANEGIGVFRSYPAQLAVPALYICLIMLSFNLLGDRIQDVCNPRLRRLEDHGRNTENRTT